MGTVATLTVRVTAAIADFEKNMASLEKSMGRTGAKLQSMGRDLTTGLTLPLVAIGGTALKMSVDFDTAMTKVRTLASESEANIKTLKQSVLALAPSVGVGPTQLADALLAIESTGFRGAQAMSILEMSAKGSAIGMGNTTDIARALTAAVNAYGVENLSAAQAADILTATVDAGGAEAAELSTEIGRVVGVAAQLGVSFDQVGAFIATYTKLGLNAAEATTGLSGVLNMILSPSKEAAKALASIGMSADGLRKSVKDNGLDEALIDLLQHAKGDGDVIGALFGNVRALAGVMGTAGSQADTYRQVLDQISHSANTLNERFAIWKTTTAATWKEFTAQVQVAGIQLGDTLAPSFSKVLQAVAPLLDDLAGMVKWFSELPGPVQEAAIGLLAVGAALGPIVYAIGTLMTTGSAVIGFFRTLFSLSPPAWMVSAGGMAAGVLGFAYATRNVQGVNGMPAWGAAMGDGFDVPAGGSDINLPKERGDINLPGVAAKVAGASGPPPISPEALEKIKAYQHALDGVIERLRGTQLVDTAKQWIAAINQIGGIGHLTHEELTQFQEDITKAVEKMKLMGQVVPNTWNIIAESSANAVRIAQIYAGLGDQMAMAHHGSGTLMLQSTSLAPGLGLSAPVGDRNDASAVASGPSKLSQLVGGKSGMFGGMNDVFQRAFEGGGGVMGAVQSYATSVLSNGLSMIPVVGPILSQFSGAIVAGVKKLASLFNGGEGHKANLERDDKIKQYTGLDNLGAAQDQFRKLATEAGLTDYQIRQVFDTKKVDAFQSAFQTATDKIKQFNDEQAADQQRLTDAIQKYGFTFEELGTKLQTSQLNDQAKELVEDWRVLAGAGIDVATVNTHMADAVNQYLQAAIQTGIEVPYAMKPILESMMSQGLLFDAAGNQITDLQAAGITFAETMTQGFDRVVQKLQELIDKLNGAGAALGNVTTAAGGMGTTPTTDIGDVGTDGNPTLEPSWYNPNLPAGGYPGYGGYGDTTTGPIYGMPMAKGGSFRVSRPTMFLAGEAGPEDAMFSGANKSFADGADWNGGGSIVINDNRSVQVQGVIDKGNFVETLRQHFWDEFKKEMLMDANGVRTAVVQAVA